MACTFLLFENSENGSKRFYKTSMLRKNVKEILQLTFKVKTKATIDCVENLLVEARKL